MVPSADAREAMSPPKHPRRATHRFLKSHYAQEAAALPWSAAVADSGGDGSCVEWCGGTELHMATRTGDLARAAYLLEVDKADANAYDRWQAQPLYYASLCGHVELVRLLLRSGARCERLTFDGERCLYAALNDETRRCLLRDGFAYGAARSHDAWLDFLENAFDNRDDAHARYRDTRFRVGSEEEVGAHACVLAARCPYLARRFKLAQARAVTLPDARFDAALFAALLRWCYTCRLALPPSSLDSAAALLRQVQLPELAARLQAEADGAPAGTQRVVVEPPREEAKAQLCTSLQLLLDVSRDDTSACGSLAPEQLALLRRGAARFRLADDGDATFWAQPAFLGPRSPFFDALLSRWTAASEEEHMPPPIALHDVSVEVFQCLLAWAYTDTLTSGASLELLLELLDIADRFLLDGLKQRAGLMLIPHVNASSCVPLLRLAERTSVERLGAAAAAAVAEHLEALADDEGLEECVRESAAAIRGRQDADSIPVLDDIAFQVTRLHGGGGALSDEEEEAKWASLRVPSMQPQLTAEQRRETTAAMRRGAASERRRKAAMLAELAAKVQGWEIAAPRSLRL